MTVSSVKPRRIPPPVPQSNLAVTAVGGDLTLKSNDGLTSLSDLASLVTVGGGLHISNNPGLTELSGLELLTEVGGDLTVRVDDQGHLLDE